MSLEVDKMLFIGKLVNTHGIKGEVRIISDFKYKDEVFKENSNLYIKGEKYQISTYRRHKNYDMVTFKRINNINDIIHLKGQDVFINREEFTFTGPLNEDLYGKKVYDKGKYIGILEKIEKAPSGELLVIKNEEKQYLIPYVDEFVDKIDENIELKLIKGFIDED